MRLCSLNCCLQHLQSYQSLSLVHIVGHGEAVSCDGSFGQIRASLCLHLEGWYLLQYQMLGVSCWSDQGNSGALRSSCHGSNPGFECRFICDPCDVLELGSRFLCRLQSLHCFVFADANACHGALLLLLLHLPSEYVANLIVFTAGMVEQLGHGHGNLSGVLQPSGPSLLRPASSRRSPSICVAGICNVSDEHHWDLGADPLLPESVLYLFNAAWNRKSARGKKYYLIVILIPQ